MFTAYAIQVLPGWKPRNEHTCQSFPGRFLISPLNGSTQIWSLGEDIGWKFEVISFFNGIQTNPIFFAYGFSVTSQTLLPEEFDRLLGKKIGRTGTFGSLRLRLVWADGALEAIVPEISRFLRDSGSLAMRDFVPLNALHYMADGKGFAVVGHSGGVDRPSRLLHTICLAGAYQVAMNEATESLAFAATKPEASEHALRDWTIFLARFYTSEPVLSTTVELVYFYTAIRERLRIDSQYRELTEQLHMYAELVAINRRDADSKRFTRFQVIASVIGVGIAVGSFTAALISVSPEQASTSANKWWSCISQNWATCTTPTTAIRPSLPLQPKTLPAKKPTQQAPAK